MNLMCRHQHRVGAALQARPLTTLPASVLYAVDLDTPSKSMLGQEAPVMPTGKGNKEFADTTCTSR